MDSFSLGLKKFIFSKRDTPLLQTTHAGRERKRKSHSNVRRRGERDTSPFEELEASSFEMTDAAIGVREQNHRVSLDSHVSYLRETDRNDMEKQEDASGFEEIIWQDDGHASVKVESHQHVTEVGLLSFSFSFSP